MSENFMDMFGPQQYKNVENVEVVFDGNDNPIAKEDLTLTPMQVIKGMAKTLGQTINDPDPSCKKCYGLGYVGRDSESKAPIPCMCLYPKESLSSSNQYIQNRMRHRSRAERREIQRMMKKQIKKQNKTLQQIDEAEIDNV